jgi:hypothetical protein
LESWEAFVVWFAFCRVKNGGNVKCGMGTNDVVAFLDVIFVIWSDGMEMETDIKSAWLR